MSSIQAQGVLNGTISKPQFIDGGTSSTLPQVTEADDGRVLIVEDGKWVCNDLPIYNGEYTVTPLADGEQTLLTKGKYNTRDITVEKIPYYEVSNDEGGTTINIG